jgi:hypothetical protein
VSDDREARLRQSQAMERARLWTIEEAAKMAKSADPHQAAYGRAAGHLLGAYHAFCAEEIMISNPRTLVAAIGQVMGAMLANAAWAVAEDRDRWLDTMGKLIVETAKEKLEGGHDIDTTAH